MISCTNCGAEQPGDRRFCTMCGQRLGADNLLGSMLVAESPARPSHNVAIAFAVAVVLAVVVGAGWLIAGSDGNSIEGAGTALAASTKVGTPAQPGHPSSHSPAPTATPAAAEARSVNALLDKSSRSRTVITPELAALTRGCDKVKPATAVADLQTAIHDRTDILRELPTLSIGAIPNGPALRQGLVRAMTASVQADRDYLRWVQQLASSGCTSTDRSGLIAGNSTSTTQATPAKRAFVSMWNPVAQKYGLPHRADGDL